MFRFITGALAVSAVMADERRDIYAARIRPIVDGGATGNVRVNIRGNGNLKLRGTLSNLESNLNGTNGVDCTATNGCGVHIHSGFSCDNSASQGGHFYTGAADPWTTAGYETTASDGTAQFKFFLDMGRNDIEGRALVVHANDGSRIGCGILRRKRGAVVLYTAKLQPIAGVDTNADGFVTVFANPDGNVQVVGLARNLESDIDAALNDCDAANGCGAHIHAGYSCQDSTTQLGHFYATASDPWSVGYETTNALGNGAFSFDLDIGRGDIEGRAFVLHNSAGGRIACGILEAVPL